MKTTSPVVLITGASSGIGAEAVDVFAAAGYDVIMAARRLDRLIQHSDALKTTYPNQRIVPLECDVCSDTSVEQLFVTVQKEFGKLNVLVNNAGYGVYGSVEETSIATYQQNMETNYIGAIRCTQRALPLLREAAKASKARWGATIVMVSSIVGRRAMPRLSSYSATKFAMEALSESLRVELHDERIAVSVVNPGATKTEFGDSAVGNRPSSFLSFERGMAPKEVAEVILKAAKGSTRNQYLTLPGKLGVFAQWLSPRLLDWAMLRTWRNG
ncbi:MAG: SDR family NAD(P)-dependent oxidoreductase [Planctomycetota bacterium]